MAEYSQYKSESEGEKGTTTLQEAEKSDSSDEVVFIELEKK